MGKHFKLLYIFSIRSYVANTRSVTVIKILNNCGFFHFFRPFFSLENSRWPPPVTKILIIAISLTINGTKLELGAVLYEKRM